MMSKNLFGNKLDKNKLVNRYKKEIGLIGIILILFFVFSFITEYFLTSSNLLNITRQISVNFIVAIGATLVILSGEIDLSVGSNAALSGMSAAFILSTTNSISLALLGGIITGGLVGLINGLIIVFGKVQSFIVTLSMLGIARGITLAWSGGKPISGLPFEFSYFGAGYWGIIPIPTIISLCVFILGYLFLNRTKHGLYIRSIGANREAAKYSAIPVSKYRIYTFIIQGLTCGVGGIILTSKLLSAQPAVAHGLELDVIAAVILGGASLAGGVGTLIGTLLGATIMGIISNGMNLVGISAFYQQIVRGIIIIVAIAAQKRA